MNTIKSKDMEIKSFDKQVKALDERIVEFKLEIKEEKSNTEALRKEHKKELVDLESKLEHRLIKEIESLTKSYTEKLELEKKSLALTLKSLANDKKELELANKQEIDDFKSQIQQLKKVKDKKTATTKEKGTK